MMSIRLALLAAAASLTLAGAASAQPVPSTADVAKQRVFANIGLTNSECIRYDETNDRYIISNLNTRGPDNNGYISLMSPDGAITNLKFIEGGKNGVTLIDPLGIYIRNGMIWGCRHHPYAQVRPSDRRAARRSRAAGRQPSQRHLRDR